MLLGWKAKAEKLRLVLVTAGHQPARPLPPNIVKILEMFRHAASTGDGSRLHEIATMPDDVTAPKPLWEPAEIGGWKFQATMYLADHPLTGKQRLWWLVHAERKNPVAAISAAEISLMHRVVQHLGADPERDRIIGPGSEPPGAEPPPMAWYTWVNVAQLFEMQFKRRGKRMQSRIVPAGTPGSDDFEPLDLSKRSDEDPS